AAPVVAEKMMRRVTAVVPGRRSAEAGGGQDIEQIVVLGESEEPGHHGRRPEQRAGDEVVAALGEREGERKAEVVVPDGVAEVEPDRRAVRAQEPAPHDSGDEHHGRHVDAGTAQELERVCAAPAAGERAREHHPAAGGEDAPHEGGKPVAPAVGRAPLSCRAPATHIQSHYEASAAKRGRGAAAVPPLSGLHRRVSYTAGNAPCPPIVAEVALWGMARRLLLPGRSPNPGGVDAGS